MIPQSGTDLQEVLVDSVRGSPMTDGSGRARARVEVLGSGKRREMWKDSMEQRMVAKEGRVSGE